MMVSGRTVRGAVVGLIGAGAILFGGIATASAEPTPAPPAPAPAPPAPGCTAADLAVASGTVGTAMGDYLFTHPWVNDFFTSLRGQPNEEIHDRVQTYMDANPQVESEITGIRQPLTELRSRCDLAQPQLGS
ncbi:MAG TPA: heme-binding protein [Mycobacterium sp.]